MCMWNCDIQTLFHNKNKAHVWFPDEQYCICPMTPMLIY